MKLKFILNIFLCFTVSLALTCNELKEQLKDVLKSFSFNCYTNYGVIDYL